MPMKREKVGFKFSVVILAALLGAGIVFPEVFNLGITKISDYLGVKLPHIPEVPFSLGLDLQGGSHLIYRADLFGIEEDNKKEAMKGLRDVIERRVNVFGVAEPEIRVEKMGGESRLIVELPGIKDSAEAIKMIGETPFLEFKEEREESETKELLENVDEGESSEEDHYFKSTSLTGRYLKEASVSFNQQTMEPLVNIKFNEEGAKIFKELTKKNKGKRLAIYIDGVLISAPVVQEFILNGEAQISGNFSLEEARSLARNLNAGALPIPIELISQNTIGPTLGKISLEKSLKAALWGIMAVALFMLVLYRLPGVFAVLSLGVYGLLLLSLFKLLPVTLTLAGIGGAILSVGMAVDANVLIFERLKEERKAGRSFPKAIEEGFRRAWPSIRDSNITTLLVALIMFSFGVSFIKGFALTLSLGIVISLFSAIFITKTFLTLFAKTERKRKSFL